MRDYQTLRGMHKDRSRDIIKTQMRLVNPNATDEDLEKTIESGHEQIFATTERAKTAQEALISMQDRRKELIKLQKSLEEVHQMFIDLSILVETQGEVLNRIAYTINNTKEDVIKSTQELRITYKQKRKCLLM
jgi:t-SNARE complex subunit (syntaxin)